MTLLHTFSCTLGSLLSFTMNSQLLCKVTFLSSGWSVITLGLVLCHSIKKRSLIEPAYLSPQTQLYNPASYTCTQCAHCWFNPLIFKISLVILLTVCQMILIMLVWRICIGSTYNPLLDIFLYSHHVSAWYCIDIVRRNSVLVTHGS